MSLYETAYSDRFLVCLGTGIFDVFCRSAETALMSKPLISKPWCLNDTRELCLSIMGIPISFGSNIVRETHLLSG